MDMRTNCMKSICKCEAQFENLQLWAGNSTAIFTDKGSTINNKDVRRVAPAALHNRRTNTLS